MIVADYCLLQAVQYWSARATLTSPVCSDSRGREWRAVGETTVCVCACGHVCVCVCVCVCVVACLNSFMPSLLLPPTLSLNCISYWSCSSVDWSSSNEHKPQEELCVSSCVCACLSRFSFPMLHFIVFGAWKKEKCNRMVIQFGNPRNIHLEWLHRHQHTWHRSSVVTHTVNNYLLPSHHSWLWVLKFAASRTMLLSNSVQLIYAWPKSSRAGCRLLKAPYVGMLLTGRGVIQCRSRWRLNQWVLNLLWKMASDSAVLTLVGSSFHHWGARTEKSRDIAGRPLFSLDKRTECVITLTDSLLQHCLFGVWISWRWSVLWQRTFVIGAAVVAREFHRLSICTSVCCWRPCLQCI